MLSLSNLSDAWDQRQCLCVAVSPIVGRQAVKGPLAQLIDQLANQPASADAVANHYGDRVDGWVVQEGDTLSTSAPVLQTQTLMTNPERRKNLARAILDWAQTLRSSA